MDHLSDKARAARQDLQDAATEYQHVVEQVIESPRGEFVERLRHAQQKVSGAAAVWALAYVEGSPPDADFR